MVGKLVVSVFSLILVVGVVVGVVVTVNRQAESEKNDSEKLSPQKKAVSQFCAPTEYEDACIKTLNNANTADPKELVKATILSTQEAVKKVYNLSDSLIVEASKDNRSKMALEDCKDMLQFAIQDLQASFSTVGDSELKTIDNRTAELMTWLNAVITYQQTCLDGFVGDNNTFKDTVKNGMVDATQLTSNALAIVNELSKILESFGLNLKPISNRRLLQVDNDGYPSWFSAADRKLLASFNKVSITPNAVVAKDGSGQYKTIQAALDAYPKNLKGRYIIYVKAGIYDEYITVTQDKPNVLIYGDGSSKTIVTGSKNFAKDGISTFRTATFSAVGTGFVAKSMGFVNTAGPDGHQAVALRIQSDYSAIFDCRIDGYQDSLYTHAYRQFYRNCVISGTVDFIFGDGTAIIQNSWIIVRRPNDNQKNTVTAQGRDIKQQTTALVIHNCTIVPDEKLFHDRFKIPTYLGRPWKDYATTVFMENTFGDFIHPEGYMPFVGNNALNTCKYYEYWNRGPGANTNKRVKWPGVKDITKKEAEAYTVWSLFKGDLFLKDVGIPCNGLLY